MNVYTVRKLHQFQIKKSQNALPNIMDIGGIYLNNDVLEISMFDFVKIDHDRPLDDNFIVPIRT